MVVDSSERWSGILEVATHEMGNQGIEQVTLQPESAMYAVRWMRHALDAAIVSNKGKAQEQEGSK